MRLAIDASRTTVARQTGTEHYARQLIAAMIRRNTQHEITLYFRDTPPHGLFPESPRVTYKVIPFPRLWTHYRFARELWRDRPDVTFVPAHTLPFVFPGRGVVTVHDLGFHRFPAAHPAAQRWYLDWTTRFSQWRARMVLCDSQATATDLNTFYWTPPEKYRVVYPGVDTARAIVPRRDAPVPSGAAGSLHSKYNLPQRYFLYIGTLQPRKNIARLVQAYAKWRADHPREEIGLVLAGGKGWLYDPKWTEGVPGVVMPGYVDDADKATLYAGSVALVFPSLYEGFGFPVVEAMVCGTPVICSNTSSLPELASEAALLVDPQDVNAIAAAMGRVSNDTALRGQMREKGFGQAARFTWEKAAEAAWRAIELAMNPAKPQITSKKRRR